MMGTESEWNWANASGCPPEDPSGAGAAGGTPGGTLVEWRDPADLRLHPLQKALPDPTASPSWSSFVEGLHSLGPENCPPLVITQEGLIMDGGRRWRAARQMQWTRVPSVVRPEHEVAVIMECSLMGQRHWTLDARVYVMLGLLPEIVQSAEWRRLENLRRGVKTFKKAPKLPKSQFATSGDLTVAYWCERWGCTRDTFFRARRVRELFSRHPELREEWEPRLLSNEICLSRLVCALGGAQTDQAKREQTREEARQLDLFADAFQSLRSASQEWGKFAEEKRRLILAAWRKTCAALPEDMAREMAGILEERTRISQ